MSTLFLNIFFLSKTKKKKNTKQNQKLKINLHRKFKGTEGERSLIKFSYMGGDLTTAQLKKLIETYN